MSNINVGTVSLTNGLKLPSFTNSNRPTGVEGLMIYNSEKQTIQAYISGQWSDIGGGGKKLVEFKLWGAGGGSGSQQRSGTNYHTNTFYNVKEGGAGGFLTASFNINSGTSLLLSVGGGGKGALIAGNPSDALGGYNGGGGGTYTSSDASGGGGGYTGVFVGTKSQANALIIAPGGGGGGGGPGYPGNANDKANGGGGITNSNGVGNNGTTGYTGGATAGGGGTTAGGVGGAGGAGQAGAAGSTLQGGNAVHHRNVWGSGGGGGGGWYGGGSGANDGTAWSGGGGGAGSAFIRESGIATSPTNSDIVSIEYVAHTFGLQTFGRWGDGTAPGGYESMRMPTGTTDSNYPGNNVGYGGAFRLINQGGPAGFDGNNGAIVYRIAGGAWTTVLFSGTDTTIVV
jgi:hypothetical protein